jgi:hypothetical protein
MSTKPSEDNFDEAYKKLSLDDIIQMAIDKSKP